MKRVWLSEDEINNVMDILVSILLLGNVNFDTISKPGVGDVSVISNLSITLLH